MFQNAARVSVASMIMLAGSAQADITQAAYSSNTQFIYNIIHVPDFDQRRAGLFNDGRFYCVPTSFLNWAAYISAHGNPSLAPGPDWYLSSNYNSITANDLLMGLAMQTNPTGGTPVGRALTGGNAWLGNKAFVIYDDRPVNGTRTLGDMANLAGNGALIMPRVWWMGNVGGDNYVHNGGHVVCMSYAARSGSTQQIGIRDPGSDESPDNLNAQSANTTDVYNVFDDQIFAEGLPRFWPKMAGYGSNSNAGFIVGFYAIIPTTVIVPQPTSIRLLRANITKSLNNALQDEEHPTLIPARRLSRWAKSGTSPFDIVYAMEPADRTPSILVYWNDLLDEEYVLGQVPNIEDVAGSRMNTFYALDGRVLRCYDPKDPMGNYETANIVVPDDAAAITYDDATDKVVLLDPVAGRLLCYEPHLPAGVPPTIISIPNDVPIDPAAELHTMPGEIGTSGGFLLVNPGSTSAWLLAEDSSTGRFEGTPVAPAGNTDPIQSATPTPGGLAFVINDIVVELEQDDDGVWIPGDGSVITGINTGGFPIIAPGSRTNIDYEEAFNPARTNELPTQFEPVQVIGDCLADTNFDGMLSPADFSAWIALFNIQNHNADQNRDGMVSPADFSAWVANYNAGCD